MKIIFSNQWEKLGDALARQLFASAPFTKRIVLVPSDGMRTFLLFHLTKTLGIAAGMKICSLEKGIAELTHGNKRIPLFIELSLAIEALLCAALDHPIYAPVAEYAISDKEQRMGSLADQLARHFMRYGLYGGRFLHKWLSEDGWQQRLWRTLFSQESPWTYPLQAVASQLIETVEVHLFGFPALAEPYLHFFARGGAWFYHFSVCAEYWEDLCSDREKLAIDRRLSKKGASLLLREEMQRYLEERHPLLANWGKLGRESMKAQSAYDFDGVEQYELPQTDTLLGALQKSILFMQEIEPVQDNRSIQLHSAPSKQREVEAMLSVLLTLFDEHDQKGDPLCLSDVLIFAPDIRVYAPYIHTLLDNAGIAHEISGLKMGSLSSSAQGFFHLLSLADDELSVQGMLKLFSYPAFCKRWGFYPEDVETLGQWLKSAQVRSGKLSWAEGLDRLLFEFCIEDTPCVSQTQTELFNTFYVCLQSVLASLDEMRCMVEKSLDEWLDWARGLLLTHFDCDEQNEPLLREMQGLQQRAVFAPRLPFTTLLRVLHHFFEKESGSIDSQHLHKIGCASLKSGAARSARVIYLLGMDEESFPRQDLVSSLYALPRAYPAKGDEDRYLFLELLVSARDYFLLSYERNNTSPSRLIEELMTTLKDALLTLHHPLFAFDPFYFSPTCLVKNYNTVDYALAKAQATMQTEKRAFFCWNSLTKEESRAIELRNLRKLGRHPLQFYFNHRHGIYLKSEDTVDEAFCLSPLQKFALKRMSLTHSFAEITEQSHSRGILPNGLFKEVALDVLAEEVQEQEQCLRALGVQGSDLFSIELSAQCRHPMRLREGGWVVPALRVRGIPIVGMLSDVTPQGLLVNVKQDVEGVLAVLPLYLIFLHVKDLCEGVGSSLLFAKEGEKSVWQKETIPLLEAYIDYYFLALDKPSPLMPKWAGRLLKEEKEPFCALVDNAFEKELFYKDAYLEWMRSSGIAPEPREWYERWTPYLQEHFKPVLEWISTF